MTRFFPYFSKPLYYVFSIVTRILFLPCTYLLLFISKLQFLFVYHDYIFSRASVGFFFPPYILVDATHIFCVFGNYVNVGNFLLIGPLFSSAMTSTVRLLSSLLFLIFGVLDLIFWQFSEQTHYAFLPKPLILLSADQFLILLVVILLFHPVFQLLHFAYFCILNFTIPCFIT